METLWTQKSGTSASKNGKQEVLLYPSFLEKPHIIYNTEYKNRIRKQYLIIKMFYK
jgi:hypothetical protein